MAPPISPKSVLKHDPCPAVEPAGYQPYEVVLSAGDCLAYPASGPYTKRTLTEPPPSGASRKPAGDGKARALTHGLKTYRGVTLAETLQAPQRHPLIQERLDAKEAIYHRVEHNPLGKSYPTHKTQLPSFTQAEDFRFGDPTHLDEGAKLLISPPPKTTQEQVPIIGQKSCLFKSLHPGERRRVYGEDWTIPKAEIRTIQSHATQRSAEGHQVRDAVFWEGERQQQLRYPLESVRVADYRDKFRTVLGQVKPDEFTAGDLLGSPRHPVLPRVSPEVFLGGRPAGLLSKFQHHRLKGNRGKRVEERIDSNYAPKITEDLPYGGKQNPVLLLPGLAQEHVFGVTSIRKRPAVEFTKKFGDDKNYGDELPAKAVLYPMPRNLYSLEQLALIERFMTGSRPAAATQQQEQAASGEAAC